MKQTNIKKNKLEKNTVLLASCSILVMAIFLFGSLAITESSEHQAWSKWYNVDYDEGVIAASESSPRQNWYELNRRE